jgi:hypothetical protein
MVGILGSYVNHVLAGLKWATATAKTKPSLKKVQFLDFQLKWFMNALIEKVNSTGRPQHSVCFDTGQPNE